MCALCAARSYLASPAKSDGRLCHSQGPRTRFILEVPKPGTINAMLARLATCKCLKTVRTQIKLALQGHDGMQVFRYICAACQQSFSMLTRACRSNWPSTSQNDEICYEVTQDLIHRLPSPAMFNPETRPHHRISHHCSDPLQLCNQSLVLGC